MSYNFNLESAFNLFEESNEFKRINYHNLQDLMNTFPYKTYKIDIR
jgi:hypothetical protein